MSSVQYRDDGSGEKIVSVSGCGEPKDNYWKRGLRSSKEIQEELKKWRWWPAPDFFEKDELQLVAWIKEIEAELEPKKSKSLQALEKYIFKLSGWEYEKSGQIVSLLYELLEAAEKVETYEKRILEKYSKS